MNAEVVSNKIDLAIKKWVQANSLIDHPCISQHLDEFVPKYSNFLLSTQLNTCLLCFEKLIEHLGDKIDYIKPILIIPLENVKEEIDLTPPENIEALMSQIDQFEPPSLALVSRRFDMFMVEKNEFLLTVNLFELPVGCTSYYRCYSDPSIADYGRAVYVEYYPKQYSKELLT